jgi:putative Mn2+ efflux pump MntP
MTKSFAGAYVQLIPPYIGYLIIAFAGLYLIKTEWRRDGDKDAKHLTDKD